MASKGPEAFRTISEVADELDLPQHVLRFWETRFTQIRPMKRGGGRRYYRPDDVELLRGIRHLLYSEGYTIRGVQRILKENGPRTVVAAGRGGDAAVARDEDDEPGYRDIALQPVTPRKRAVPPPVHPVSEDGDEPAMSAADDDLDFRAFAPVSDTEPESAVDDPTIDDDDAQGDDADGDSDAAGDEDDESDDDDAEGGAEDDGGDEDDDHDDDADDLAAAPVVSPPRSRATPLRTQGRPQAQTAAGTFPLTRDDIRRLTATLSDLLELKRRLDQAR